jgi:hypothetical protein
MEFQNPPAACVLMKAIDVLSYDSLQSPGGLETRQRTVPGVGLGSPKLPVSLFLHEPVLPARLGAGQKILEHHRLVATPDPARTAEIRDTTLGADAGSGKSNGDPGI